MWIYLEIYLKNLSQTLFASRGGPESLEQNKSHSVALLNVLPSAVTPLYMPSECPSRVAPPDGHKL
eukprot:scaffold55425_cov72-Phaeocystis_antarctica.AAC.5